MVSDRTRTEATLGDYEGSGDADDGTAYAATDDVDPIIVANPNGGAEILGPNDPLEDSTE
jgi:hypothetical protein